jgi:hypothetical protein
VRSIQKPISIPQYDEILTRFTTEIQGEKTMKSLSIILMTLLALSAISQSELSTRSNNIPKAVEFTATKSRTNIYLKVIAPGSSGPPASRSIIENISATPFRVKLSNGVEYAFAVIHDPLTKSNYVVSQQNDFLISTGSGIIACRQAFGTFMYCKSFFGLPESAGANTIIDQFTPTFPFDDINKTLEFEKTVRRDRLEDAAPFGFFNAHSGDGSQPGQPTIRDFDVVDDIVKLDLLSEEGKFSGTFWIDLKARKVVKAIVDGEKMDIGHGYGKPLKK